MALKTGIITATSKSSSQLENVKKTNPLNVFKKSSYLPNETVPFSPAQNTISEDPFEVETGLLNDSPEILLVNNFETAQAKVR